MQQRQFPILFCHFLPKYFQIKASENTNYEIDNLSHIGLYVLEGGAGIGLGILGISPIYLSFAMVSDAILLGHRHESILTKALLLPLGSLS